MKAISVWLLLLTVTISALAQPDSKIDVLKYSYNLQLSDASDTIVGKASIRIRFLTNTDQLELDLTSSVNGKGMVVTNVTRDIYQLSFVHESDKLAISLNQKAGDTTSVVIYYKGVPADGLIIAKNKYRHRTFFADNWPNRGHNWIPCNDVPGDKAPVEFIVTAPQHYQVVANGIQIEETNLDNNLKLTHWREEVPLATKIMVIGVADFAVSLAGTVNCVPVYSWVYPEDRVKGFYDYALTVDILSYFMKSVGPYGYKKLANVQSKTTMADWKMRTQYFIMKTQLRVIEKKKICWHMKLRTSGLAIWLRRRNSHMYGSVKASPHILPPSILKTNMGKKGRLR
jgi:aminopeptidase N